MRRRQPLCPITVTETRTFIATSLRNQPPYGTSPVVSISILSYNQREYLARAIESVLDQEVDFPCEIIIGDDCSSDGSQDLLREYQARYPHLIHLILHPRRYENEVPGRTNNITNLSNCRGEFTAMLDGDDWYCDPTKLSRQVKMMRAHPELSMCVHDSSIEFAADAIPHIDHRRYSQAFDEPIKTGIETHRKLVLKPGVRWHISSILFRTALLHPFPEWFRDIISADVAIMYILTERGPYYYDDRVMSVRWYGARNWTLSGMYGASEYIQKRIDELKIYRRHLPAICESPRFLHRMGFLYLDKSRRQFEDRNYVDGSVSLAKAVYRLRTKMTPENFRSKIFPAVRRHYRSLISGTYISAANRRSGK